MYTNLILKKIEKYKYNEKDLINIYLKYSCFNELYIKEREKYEFFYFLNDKLTNNLKNILKTTNLLN